VSWENTALLLALRGLIRALFVAFVVALWTAALVGCAPEREPIRGEVWQPVDCQVEGVAGRYRTTAEELNAPDAAFLRVFRVGSGEPGRNVWIPRDRVEVCEAPAP